MFNNRRVRIDAIAFWSSCLAFCLYVNSFKAGFVYDDNRAILSNQDVLPETPWTGLLHHDYWGTPLSHSGSHKSFRPLTTLSYRINCYFSGFNPLPYHVTNVVLHTLTTWLFVRVARIIFRFHSWSTTHTAANRSRKMAVIVSSLLFASHPIHTEAVSGIVGRADVGSTGLALSAFLVYVHYVKCRDKQLQHHRACHHHHHHHHHHHQDASSGSSSSSSSSSSGSGISSGNNNSRSYSITQKKFNGGCGGGGSRNEQQQHQNSHLISTPPSSPSPHHPFYFRGILYLTISILLAAAAMFTKEQGITILLVCATYDLIRSIIRARQYQGHSPPSLWKLECCSSVVILGLSLLALFHLRLSLMGGFEPPKFAKADNPTAHHPSVCTRLATFLFLPVVNLALLIYPYCLSYDWSMESIPRVQEISDPRNLITLAFYSILLHRIFSSCKSILLSHNNQYNSSSNNNNLMNKSSSSSNHKQQQQQDHHLHPMDASPLKKQHQQQCHVCRFSSSSQKWSTNNNNSILSTLSAAIASTTTTTTTTNTAVKTVILDDFHSGGGGGCIKKVNNGIHHQFRSVSSQKQARGSTQLNGGPTILSGGYNNNNNNGKLSKTLATKTSRRSPSSLISHNNHHSNHCSSFMSLIPTTAVWEHGTFLLELAFLIFPFLPATNLFFYVGFVVAERVLYMPSVGFSLLIGHGFLHLWARTEQKEKNHHHHHHQQHPHRLNNGGVSQQRFRQLLVSSALLTLLFLSARTVRRNEDWRDEEELYSSGISINPPKSWGNLGNVLNSLGRSSEAEVAYRQALRFRSNMADVHYNLGLVLEQGGRLDEALTSYRSAIHFRPLLAPAYVNAGQVLTRQGKIREALELYEKCFKLTDEGVKDLRNHIEAKVSALLRYGKLLVEEDDDPRKAIGIYRQAVKLMPPNFSQAQSIYNAMGEALSRLGEASEAEEWFKEALKTKPDHIPAHLTYGKMLARNKTRLLEAESWFRRAKRIAPADATVYQHYGQFLASQGRHAEAAESYVTADALTPNDYEIVVGAANGLRQAGDTYMAEIYYGKAAALRPQEARAHMNLGAILHLNRKYPEAHKSYLTALQLKPDDPMTLENLKKLCQLQGRQQVLLSACSSRTSSTMTTTTTTTNAAA